MILDSIQQPQDIKKLGIEDLEILAQEIRGEIIQECHLSGGHLGSSLGSVELILALHYVFDSPNDPILFDVGHQSYAHKLLTGRRDKFNTLRKWNGISGFPSRTESAHDWFGTGHSSTALSALAGVSFQRKNWSMAMIGDGALTGGMAYEALQQFVSLDHGPVLVVFNDNGMSISENVNILKSRSGQSSFKEFFEFFDFEYIGPEQGHDVDRLVQIFQHLKDHSQSDRGARRIVLHCLTEKGHGYAPAENRPSYYHGVTSIDKVSTGKKEESSWSAEFGKAVETLLNKHPEVVVVTPAMLDGSGLQNVYKKFPTRVLDVGICEQHAATFCAALATNGKTPILSIYSTFLQRAVDQLIHDICIQNLPVILAIDRSGYVGQDGVTHQGIFDLPLLASLPNLEIFSPANVSDLQDFLEDHCSHPRGPVAVRYPRGVSSIDPPKKFKKSEYSIKFSHRFYENTEREKRKGIYLTVGSAAQTWKKLTQDNPSLEEHWCHLEWLSPGKISEELLKLIENEIGPQGHLILVEHSIPYVGGIFALYSALEKKAALHGEIRKTKLFHYPEKFVDHGSIEDQEKSVGIHWSDIAKEM